MKKIIILLIISMFSVCQKKKDTNEKNILLLSIVNYSNEQKYLEECFYKTLVSCPAVLPSPISTNIKSMQVFQGDNLLLESEIAVYSGDCGSSSKYRIEFFNNSQFSRLTTYMNRKKQYCAKRFTKADGTILTQEGIFQGDIETVTEITIGEYKFVPVR